VKAVAASADRASRPTAAASQEIAVMKSRTIPRAASQSRAEALGRQPISRPAAITSAVATRLRARLATTWPMRREEPKTGIERMRSTIPFDMSVATATAVVPAPKPAQRTISPGTM
jgi:hypothetical protein